MMVMRYGEDRLILILQIDHSRIAGLLAAHWGNSEFAGLRPYDSVVLAAQEHDSGWWDWEIKPTLDAQGYPPDYIGSIMKLGRRVWLDFYTHGIDRLAAQDPYAGYTISMHGDGLLTQGMGLLPYMPDYTRDPDVQQFIQEQRDFRTQLLAQLRQQPELGEVTTDEHLWLNFKYMEVFDQFAQFVCNRYPFNSTERKNGPTNKLSNTPVPVRPGVDDTIISVEPQDERRAVVRPWPFNKDELELKFPARLVPNRPYKDQDEFLRDFYKAERITVDYVLQKAS